MFENLELKAKQDAFYAQLTPGEREVFDAARRAGSSFGQAELCLTNHRRRVAKAAAKSRSTPTMPSRPTPTTARPSIA
ncbi:MAG: hypothetical protein KJ000_23960 [Pirellulaceae bacterium]|nr:hypothetical protein [Pirellulaceae bacterium]